MLLYSYRYEEGKKEADEKGLVNITTTQSSSKDCLFICTDSLMCTLNPFSLVKWSPWVYCPLSLGFSSNWTRMPSTLLLRYSVSMAGRTDKTMPGDEVSGPGWKGSGVKRLLKLISACRECLLWEDTCTMFSRRKSSVRSKNNNCFMQKQTLSHLLLEIAEIYVTYMYFQKNNFLKNDTTYIHSANCSWSPALF